MPYLIDGRYILSEQATCAIIWTFTSGAILSTALRLFSRACVVKALGLDDFLILFGQITAIVVAAFQHWQVYLIWKSYRKSFDIGIAFFFNNGEILDLINKMYRSAILADYSYLLVLPILKCSILAFYRRISPRKKHHYFLYAVAFVMLAQGIINLLVSIFAVDPPSARWTYIDDDKSIVRERYADDSLQPINSGFQVLFDIIILAMPAKVIWRTKFNRRDKVGLVIIYLLSFMSLGSTIARLVKVAVYTDKGNPITTMRGRIDTIYWTIIEMMTVIICANLPAMPALFRYVNGSSAEASPSSTQFSRDESGTKDSLKNAHTKSRSWYSSLTNSVHRHSLHLISRKGRSNDGTMFHSATLEEKEIGSRSGESTDASETGKSDGSPKAAATLSTRESGVGDPTTPSSCVRSQTHTSNSSSHTFNVPLSPSDGGRNNIFNLSNDVWNGAIYRTDEFRVERNQNSQEFRTTHVP